MGRKVARFPGAFW